MFLSVRYDSIETEHENISEVITNDTISINTIGISIHEYKKHGINPSTKRPTYRHSSHGIVLNNPHNILLPAKYIFA